jgi:hypothetical protein
MMENIQDDTIKSEQAPQDVTAAAQNHPVANAAEATLPGGEEEEIELGGFEDEFANVMGFTMTSLLRIIQRQQLMIETLSRTNPDLKSAVANLAESGTSPEAAGVLGEWLEECIDEDTAEDSMLFQVHAQLASLAGV